MTRRFISFPLILTALLAALFAGVSSEAFDCTTVSEIPQSECEALVALYESTNGPTWASSTSWLKTVTPCSWFGVTCDNGHVTDLAFSNYGLHGPLPAEIGNLIALTLLGLNETQVTGPLPAELGSLSSLQTLAISRSQLDGLIPPELGNLHELQHLVLEDNQLDGPLPPEIGNLTKLVSLRLNENRLSGSIPPEWGNLTAMTYFNVSENELTGSIPPELGQLASVRHLYLNNNHLSGPIPPELGQLAAFGGHTLSPDAELLPSTDDEPLFVPWSLEIGQMNDLPEDRVDPAGIAMPPPADGYLDLSCNQLSGAIPAELGNLYSLNGIDLSGNQLSGAMPAELDTFRIYYWYNFDYNMLSEAAGGDLFPYNHWQDSQTLPPTDLQAGSVGTSVTLTWTPILYTGDGGYYEISYAPATGGAYTVAGHTADKTASHFTVEHLAPRTEYLFRVRTLTPAHEFHTTVFFEHYYHQQSDLWSAYTEPVRATTYDPDADVDCGPPPTPATPYAGIPPASGMVQRQIAHCLDDAYVTEGSTIHLDNGGDYIRMGGRVGSQVPYVRYVDGLLFRDMRIPQGARIVSATLRLHT